MFKRFFSLTTKVIYDNVPEIKQLHNKFSDLEIGLITGFGLLFLLQARIMLSVMNPIEIIFYTAIGLMGLLEYSQNNELTREIEQIKDDEPVKENN